MTHTLASSSAEAVIVDGLAVAYGATAALRNVSLIVRHGERVLLEGHNGAGKSTLIRVLAGLQQPDRGTVRILGQAPDARKVRQHVGTVLHSPWLDADLTVEETLRYFSALYGLTRPAERIQAVLAQFGMTDRRGQRTGELSRGFQQRLTLARSLIHEPSLLLLDEPDTGLDEQTLDTIRDVICSASPPRTVVLTSHNRAWGTSIAHRTLSLSRGTIESVPVPERLGVPT